MALVIYRNGSSLNPALWAQLNNSANMAIRVDFHSEVVNVDITSLSSLNIPMANPRQKATSAMAYTLPYTLTCRRSTRNPICGIMDESTIPAQRPQSS